ncbi:hypothetical protein EV385_1768 [Krasilnikovia cinnamomea]|uniref:Lipoprotein LprG n=1 Tax=Krasilnikovia cinnamomea TaxID=349313 RepID=A0A4Q7ZIQ7_9ACTN|nr:hypothetical protein [Krasilnikovia cinnamomea]RZU50009.1 hypothetical protein EV385_1768 [Krasilnikovia cinnamomea]
MSNRRLAFAGLMLAAAVTVTGCGPNDKPAASGAPGAAAEQAAQPADPTAELAAAVTLLNETTMKVSMTMVGGINMTGVADPKAQTADMKMTLGAAGQGTEMEVRKVGTDVYLKIGGELGKLAGGGGKWMHMDTTKLPGGSSLGALSGDDPAGTKTLMKAVTDVKRTGEGTFTGTIDLTKSPQFGADKLKELGGKVTAVPFTAKVEQGRLVEMTVDMGGISPAAGKMTSTYSDFGTPVSVSRPDKSEITELPSEFKGLLGS